MEWKWTAFFTQKASVLKLPIVCCIVYGSTPTEPIHILCILILPINFYQLFYQSFFHPPHRHPLPPPPNFYQTFTKLLRSFYEVSKHPKIFARGFPSTSIFSIWLLLQFDEFADPFSKHNILCKQARKRSTIQKKSQ